MANTYINPSYIPDEIKYIIKNLPRTSNKALNPDEIPNKALKKLCREYHTTSE